MALQLPDSESGGSSRLTGKFSSTTTLWLLLRHFESASTGSEPSRNFTARGAPQMETGASGSGMLFYETPVIEAMGRELASFIDLQKSLGQLGLNSGSVLLRLNFRSTESPLEEAIAEIDKYFKSAGSEQVTGVQAASASEAESSRSASEPFAALNYSESLSPPEPHSQSLKPPPPPESAVLFAPELPHDEAKAGAEFSAPPSDAPSTSDQTMTGPAPRLISVFAPSSAPTPAASRQAFNEKDYEPTVAHAKLHQARLATSSVNKRLPTDAELAVQAETQAKRNADVKSVEIKVRFPDQMQVVSVFSNLDTSSTLHDFVKDLMEDENEPFSLSFTSARGPSSVPKVGHVRLIGDLGMVGRVLINVVWDAGASSKVRAGSVLKPKFQNEARQIEVKEVNDVETEETVKEVVEGIGKQTDEGRQRKVGVPKWLKLPGKK